jgi:hypothetical protein
MRFLITIARMYPGRSALTLVSLLFASVAEGLSLLLLLPSLNLLTSDSAQGPGNGLSGLGHMLTEALSAIGVTPTVGVSGRHGRLSFAQGGIFAPGEPWLYRYL